MINSSDKHSFLQWSLFALFFFLHFFIRVLPPLIAPILILELHLSLSQIAILSSCYFLCYTLSQPIISLILPKIGLRYLMSGACWMCALSALFFSHAQSFTLLLASLSMYAFFGAFGFLGCVFFATQALKQYQDLLASTIKAIGMLSAVIAINGLSYSLNFFSWRDLVRFCAGSLFIIGLIILVFGPNKKNVLLNNTRRSCLTKDYYRLLLWTSLCAGALHFPFMLFAESSIGPVILKNLQSMEQHHIAFSISMSFAAWILCAPLVGWLISKYGPFGIMRACLLLSLLAILMIILQPLSYWSLPLFLFLIGLGDIGTMGTYNLAMRMTQKYHQAFPIALVNMSLFIPGMIALSILPKILENSTPIAMIHGQPQYNPEQYQYIFGIALGFGVLFAFITIGQIEKALSKALEKGD